MNTVTFGGKLMHLEGNFPEVGQKAPDFVLAKTDLSMATLADYKGKVLALLTLPSLDTPICDLEAKRFNQEAAQLSDKLKIVIVSRDLPFAQARWKELASASQIQTLSDYRDDGFGRDYGVMMEENSLLCRAIFVIDENGILRHIQVNPEVRTHPDYDQALEAIKKTLP